MVKPPCCDKNKVPIKDGLWTEEKDAKSFAYATKLGATNWKAMQKKSGIRRCEKSCRVRWSGSERLDLGDDNFTPEEEDLIIKLHATIGSRWTIIAQQLPGRTDNDVKNLWNTKLKKKLSALGIDPITHRPFSQILAAYGNIGGFPKARTRFGCLNRDMKNAFNLKSEQYRNPQERASYFDGHFPTRIAPPAMEPSHQNFFSNDISAGDQSLHLLSQLQAITMVTESRNYINTPNIASQKIPTECASSSASSSEPPPPATTNQAAKATPGFSWCDFLLEDALVPADVQDQENAVMHPPNDMVSKENQDSYAARNEMKMPMKAAEVSSMESRSFVETMLAGENEMLSDFHGLLEEPFYY